MNPSALCLVVGLAGRVAPRTRGERRELWEIGTDLHFPQGTSCKQGPLFLGAGTRFSPQTDPFPASPFSSPLRKRPFSEFVLIHPPPPQTRVSYSHLNQFCSPTECRSVASYTVPCYSRPPGIHFLTNFLLTCSLTIFRFTSEFGLNWRIIY